MSEEIIQPEVKPVKPKSKLKWNITAGGAVLALVTFCCGAFGIGAVFSLAGDTTQAPESAITQLAVTQVAITEVAVTQVIAGPTYTLQPTYTNPPPPPPEQILVTATYPPDFTEIHRFTGSGNGTSDIFALPDGIVRIKWTHRGDSNFAFYFKNLDSGQEDMLENTIGNADGQHIMNVAASDKYLFEIFMGDGPWEIIVEFRPQ